LYLQVIITIENKEDSYLTNSFYGTVGLDYNDGFIELSETDRCGNLVGQKHYDLKYHGTGNKAKNEIRTIVSQIVKYSINKGKDLVIEDLDFNKIKSKQMKGETHIRKKYNRMIHLFDYSRYKETLGNSSFRNKVNVIKVNPAYTSKIGKEKFSGRMKLNVHQAASYVIARKGLGILDKIH